MTGKDAKQIRQRLGWSAAEMARRLGSKVETVLSWESEITSIPSETIPELQALANYVESYAQQVARQPVAEAVMKDLGVDQMITSRILER